MVGWHDVSERVGLEARLSLETGELRFTTSVGEVTERPLGLLASSGLLLESNPPIATEALRRTVTRIYRRIDDARILEIQSLPTNSDAGVKFDITVVLPHHALGSDWQHEYPKTTGHYHTVLPGRDVPSPDCYQVIHGRGLILLQEIVGKRVKAYTLALEPGTTAVLPPQYAHITINTGDEPLVFSNVCVRQPHLNYDDIYRFGGGAYYFVRSGNSAAVRPNDHYCSSLQVESLARVRPESSALEQLGISSGVPIYHCIRNPAVTQMLCFPDRSLDTINAALRYE